MAKSTQHLVSIAMMVALITVLSFIPAIPLGFIPVPITLQTLAIMLSGALLGAKRGPLAVVLFLILGIFMPVFSGGATTIPVLFGPSAGFVLAWPIAAFLIGLCLRQPTNIVMTFLIIWLFGAVLVDSIGAIWLAFSMKTSLQAGFLSSLAFLPGDSIKALIATLITINFRPYLK